MKGIICIVWQSRNVFAASVAADSEVCYSHKN